MLGLHLQRHMLVDDLRGQIAQTFQAVDVLGIHQHAVGQRAGLGTALLVGLIEQRAHLGVLGQHGLIEMGGQGFAAGFQQRDGGFDNLALTFGQHANLQVAALRGCKAWSNNCKLRANIKTIAKQWLAEI